MRPFSMNIESRSAWKSKGSEELDRSYSLGVELTAADQVLLTPLIQ